MIDRDDLRAAVGAGILTEAQATRLAGLADERRGLRLASGPSDEPFELFQGLNEIFIVVGMSILFSGWMAVTGLAVLSDFDSSPATGAIFAAIALGVLAASARYFTLRRRMVAPSIALAILTGLSLLQLGVAMSHHFGLSFHHRAVLTSATCLAGLMAYWWWIRLPFTLALVGIAALAFFFSLSLLGGTPVFELQNAFLLTAEGPFALITILIGLAALALALRYDMSDPHRVTRRAANAFWLHVVAAPAIVNTVALTLLDADTSLSNLLLFGFLLLIALFAVIIDRRSFLMAGAGYAVALSVIVLEAGSSVVILLLGAALVFLGARWEAIRGRAMAALPAFPGKGRLPPWTDPTSKDTR